jgi:hypothetical protein
MKEAKNIIGHETMCCIRALKMFILFFAARSSMGIKLTKTVIKKRFHLCIFFNTHSAAIHTAGSIKREPTHQIAGYPIRPKTTAENAAGLHICFPCHAKIYFDAIALIATIARKNTSDNVVIGGKRKNRMNPVITADSL